MICPANVMIFNKRIDRRRLKTTGELAFTDYDLDDDLLRTLSDQGFVVGYHMNAHEQALFDIDRALDLFDRDVRELSERFPINFFSAHGGVPGPDGRNNNGMPFHPDWQTKLRWVHNGHSPKFSSSLAMAGTTRQSSIQPIATFATSFARLSQATATASCCILSTTRTPRCRPRDIAARPGMMRS